MKKILFVAVVVAAIGFTSCGNKTQQAEAVDSVALIDSLSEEAVHESVNALSGVIEAKDADKLKDVLENCKTKVTELVKENPELAKSYVVKLQDFLKENKDKIAEFAANSPTAQEALNALISVDAEQGLSNFLGAIEEKAVEVKDGAEAAAQEQADNAKAAAQAKADEVKAAAQAKADEAKAAAQAKADEAKAAAKDKANKAIDNAAANAKKSLGF